MFIEEKRWLRFIDRNVNVDAEQAVETRFEATRVPETLLSESINDQAFKWNLGWE